MKREELTPIELECNMGTDVNGVVQREPWKAYDIDEVDHLLDEKDAEIEDLLRQNRELCQALQVMYSKEEYGKLQKEIESLKAKLETVNELVKTSKDLYDHAVESLKASHYAEMVDAGMRERRLKRALYRVLALWANERARLTWSWRKEQGWLKMERKCRAMADKWR